MKTMIDVRQDGIHIKDVLMVSLSDEQPVTAIKIDPSSSHKLIADRNILNGNYKKSILLRLYLWWNYRSLIK